MSTETPKIKKPRAFPHRWNYFFNLRRQEFFYVGSKLCRKTSAFSGHDSLGKTVWVNPWTRVRTNELLSNRSKTPPEHVTPTPLDITGPTS